jgi:hypothetical protein
MRSYRQRSFNVPTSDTPVKRLITMSQLLKDVFLYNKNLRCLSGNEGVRIYGIIPKRPKEST